MLFNILQDIEQPLITKNDMVQNVSSAKMEKSCCSTWHGALIWGHFSSTVIPQYPQGIGSRTPHKCQTHNFQDPYTALEKTLMPGKIEGRRRGRQKMRRLNGIIDLMDMSWCSSRRQ